MATRNPTEPGRALWQFELNGLAIEPRVKIEGQIGDLAGEWWLKSWGERLLFCLADAPQRVFAATKPLEATEELAGFFRRATASGEFGRMVMNEQALDKSEASDTGFMMIYGPDKARWTREWCLGPWLETRDARPSPLPFWHPDWQVPLPCAVNRPTRELLLARPFGEEEREDQPFVWLSGSRGEWKRVLQACATLFFASRPTDSDGNEVPEATHRFCFVAHTPFFHSWMDGASKYGIWAVPEPLRPLLSRHFVGVGWHWSRLPNRNESKREGWKVAPRRQSVEITLSREPSAHQRLEAALFLREWLRERAGLSSERSAELLG